MHLKLRKSLRSDPARRPVCGIFRGGYVLNLQGETDIESVDIEAD